MSTRLNIYTAGYPYGYVEPFLNNELDVLNGHFENIQLIPYKIIGEIQSTYNHDCTILFEEKKENKYKISIGDWFFILRIFIVEFFHISQKGFYIKKMRRHFAILKNGVLLSKWILDQDIKKTDIHYSYWMNEWALALAILKKRNNISNFSFRVNGYDIWDERSEGNYLPYRYFIYSQASKIYALAKSSANYLRAKGFFPEKITHAYFGTQDFGNAQPKKEGEKFTIFSCSGAIPLKRLEKIAEVVCCLNMDVKWIHHGEGNTIPNVYEIIHEKGQNVEFIHSRFKENYHEVLLMLKETNPDLFVNLSESEGLPVSIIEAMSFGVPILANNVGSCAEFFEKNIGILVEKNESPKEIAGKIEFLREGKIEVLSNDEIREYWRQNFSAERNYSLFSDQLKNNIG